MKNIAYTLLILLVALAGCSKEEVKSHVSFSFNEKCIDSDASGFTVNVEADCPWTIECTKGNISASYTINSGPSPVLVSIPRNNKYEDLIHELTVTSTDGTSSDKLVVHQEKLYEINADKIELISCEGKTFSIKISTNNEIKSVETPEWISLVSSRSFNEHTYTFKAEPNKSGGIRKSDIVFVGEKATEKISVEQDSFAPTDVVFDKYASIVKTKDAFIEASLVPEYADWSKLKIYSSDGCESAIESGRIHLYFYEYGEYNVSFHANSKTICKQTFWHTPSDPFNMDNDVDMYIGQELKAELYCNHPDLKIESSDYYVANVTKARNIYSSKRGSAKITAYIPNQDIYGEITIHSDYATVKAQVLSFSSYGGQTHFRFTARVDGGSDIEVLDYNVYDRFGWTVISKGNYDLSYPAESTAIIKTDYLSLRSSVGQLSLVEGFYFEIKVKIKGEVYTYKKTINHTRIGSL